MQATNGINLLQCFPEALILILNDVTRLLLGQASLRGPRRLSLPGSFASH